MKAEQFPEHPFPPQRFAHSGQIDERRIWVGRRANRGQQPGCYCGEEVPTTPGGEETHLLVSERAEVAVGGRRVTKPVSSQEFRHALRRRLGIEHQIGFHFRLFLTRKRIVEQMVQDCSVEPRGFSQLLIESGEPFSSRRKAHPHRQCFPSLRVLGEGVRLQVEENLQAVLNGAEQGVRPLEKFTLLVGEPAGSREPADRFECVASANFRSVTTAEQLQKLNRGFHVANATMADLHVAFVVSLADRLMLDPAFECFDSTDVCPG